MIVVGFFHPSSSGFLLSGKNVHPGSLRQIVVYFPGFFKHRRYQQGISQHILPVQGIAGSVLGEVQEHGTQERRPLHMGFHSLPVNIRHQPAFQIHKLPEDIAGFLVKKPGHTVGSGTMETAVGA